MTLDGLQTLAAIRAFLAERILPETPADRRGDLRAALKLMEDVELELSEPRATAVEVGDVPALQERARAGDDGAMEMLREAYVVLGREAERQVRWQSVFDVDRGA